MVGTVQFSTGSYDSFALRLGLFYAAHFFFTGVQLPFFPLWLESRGFDARTIGFVIALPVLVRIFATPVITHQADRRRAPKAALVMASAVAMLGMAAAGLVSGTVAIVAAFMAAAVAFSPIHPLTDAYALSGLAARGRAYGPVRLWGSASFVAGNIAAGALLEWVAPGNLIWLMVAALAVATAAATALVPLHAGGRPAANTSAANSPAPASPKALLRSPAFLAVAFAAATIQSSHALYYGFSAVQWRAVGFDGMLIGGLWGLGVIAEIALFAFSGRLFPHVHPATLMAAGGACAILRWTAMAFDPPVALMWPLQILHAGSFAATHLGLMAFMLAAIPRELTATATGAVATLSGIVNASATFGSGFLYAAVGGAAYLAMAAMALAGGACAIYAGRRWSGAETP